MFKRVGVGTVNYNASLTRLDFFESGSSRAFIGAAFSNGIFFNGEQVTAENHTEKLSSIFLAGGDNPPTPQDSKFTSPMKA